MKRKSLSFLIALLVALFSGLQVHAQSAFEPDPAVAYHIMNRSTSQAITRPADYADGYVKVAAFTGEANQQFKFVQTSEVSGQKRYKIQVQSANTYIASASPTGWVSLFSATGTEYWIDYVADGYVCIRNAGLNTGLGLDSGDTNVYTNKGGTGTSNQWLVYPVGTKAVFFQHTLAINDAKIVLSVFQDAANDFKQTLVDAISTAETIESTAADIDITNATSALKTIVTQYKPLATTVTNAKSILPRVPAGIKSAFEATIATAYNISNPTATDLTNSNTTLSATYNTYLAFVSAIEAAEKALTAVGIFGEAERTALQSSLTTAKDNTTSDNTTVQGLTTDLTAKTTAFKNSETAPVFSVEANTKYRILITDNNGEHVRYMTRTSTNKILPKQIDYTENPEDQLFYFEAKEGQSNEYYIKNVGNEKYLNSNGNGVNASKTASWIVKYNKYVGTTPYYKINISGQTWEWSIESGTWPNDITNMWVDRGAVRLFSVAKDPSPYDILQVIIQNAEETLSSSSNPDAVKTYLTTVINVAKAIQDGNAEAIETGTKNLKSSVDIFNNYAAVLESAKTTIGKHGNFPKEAKLALEASIVAAENISSSTEAEILNRIADLKAKTQAYINSEIIPVFTPNEDTQYRLYAVNDAAGTGNRIYFGSHNDWNCGAKTLALEFTDNQVQLYVFEKQEGESPSYKIKSIKSGKAIRTNGHTDPGVAEALFIIKYAKTKNGVDFYTLQMSNNGNYLGFGTTTPNNIDQYVSDMSVISTYPTAEKYFWSFESNAVTLKRELLSPSINAAVLLYSTTEGGELGGQYPVDKRQEFDAAIKTAQAIFTNNSITDGDQIKEAVTVLKAATDVYKAAIIIPVFEPESGASYRIANPSGTAFFSDSIVGTGTSARLRTQAFKVAIKDFNQKWTIEKINGVDSAYIIKNPSNKVLTYTNANNNNSGFTFEDLKADDAKSTTQYVKIRYAYSEKGKNYFYITTYTGDLRSITRNADSNNSYLQMRTFDATNITTHPVMFVKVGNPDLNKFTLENAILEAQAYLNAKVIGTAEGEYPQAAADVLQGIIDNANQTLTNATTQGDIDAAATPLSSAMTDFEKQIIINLENYRQIITTRTQLWSEAEVSTAIGDYYQSAIDALKVAIDEACIVYRRGYATQADLTTLNAAATAFTDAKNATTQDVRAVLEDAIDADQILHDGAVEGNELGQYASGSKAIFQGVISAARTITEEDTPEATDEEMGLALTALNTARKTFEEGIVDLDYSGVYEAIDDAKELMNGRAANEGYFDGNYPTEAYVALQSAIDVAEYFLGIPAETQLQINDTIAYLQSEITAFENSKIEIDFSILSALVNEAKNYILTINATAGSNLEASLNTFGDAVDAAEEFVDKPETTQEQVDDEVIKLNNAVKVFLNALRQPEFLLALNNAISYIETTPSEDATLTTAINDLQLAINAAEVIKESEKMSVVTQTAVNAATTNLTNKTKALVTAMTKNLDELIKTTKASRDGAEVGTGEGQHTAAEIAALSSAITSAEITLNAPASRYDNYSIAFETLKIDYQIFLSKDLINLISISRDSLENAVEGTLPGQYEVGSKATFETAVTLAETLLADGTDSNFAQYYQNAFNSLKEAYNNFLGKRVGTGIDEFAENGIAIYSYGGNLYVTGLTNNVTISGYDMGGRKVFIEQFSANEYSRQLPVGNYIISLQGYVNGSQIVIVK